MSALLFDLPGAGSLLWLGILHLVCFHTPLASDSGSGRIWKLAGSAGVYTLMAMPAIGGEHRAWFLLILMVAHVWTRHQLGGKPQLASLLVGLLALALWARDPAHIHCLAGLIDLGRDPRFIAYLLAVLFVIYPAGDLVGRLTAQWQDVIDAGDGLPNAGLCIGRIERLLVLHILLTGQVTAIGFLATAKSILRFGEAQKDPHSRRAAEYVLVGTMASFSLAIIAGMLLRAFGVKLALGS